MLTFRRVTLRLIGQTFSAGMKWECYIESLTRTARKKIGSLTCDRSFFSPESITHIYNFNF